MSAHWSDRYLGLPYVDGVQDCAALAERVLREQFGRDVYLPAERAAGLMAESRLILSLMDDYVEPTLEPLDGDAVLMLGRGRLAHVGVLALINGRRYVLHASREAGEVVRPAASDLARLGLPVEGYYRWR